MSVDFVIITALKEEQEAILTKLPPVQRLPPTDDDVHVYYRTELPLTLSDGTSGTYTLILLSIMGMTREKAAIFTTDALHRWHPRYVLLVGIAGGIAAAKVARGDVLVSEQIVDYEHQKITAKGEREYRWEVHRGDPRLLEASRHLGDGWHRMVRKKRPQPGKPAAFFGPIATGDKVVDYLPFLRELLSHWPKLIGVEMESGGVASAAFQAAKAASFFMIRGVSDLAENKDDAWRQYACHTAAAYVLALLHSGPVPLAVPALDMDSPDGGSIAKLAAHSSPTADKTRLEANASFKTIEEEAHVTVQKLNLAGATGNIEARSTSEAEAVKGDFVGQEVNFRDEDKPGRSKRSH